MYVKSAFATGAGTAYACRHKHIHVPMCVLAHTHITDNNSVQAQTYSRANVCISIYPHYR